MENVIDKIESLAIKDDATVKDAKETFFYSVMQLVRRNEYLKYDEFLISVKQDDLYVYINNLSEAEAEEEVTSQRRSWCSTSGCSNS